MKKDFKQELTELINKHSLEKEMRDTPDFILAQVCIDAMAVFSEAIARRDEWHGFRKADEKSSQDAKHNYPDDRNICKDRFKCADFMRTQPIANLIQRFKTTTDKEEKTAIAGLLKQINADASGKPQNDIPEEVKEVAGKLAKAFGARVEIHRIEIPEKKRKFRKKPRKEQGNETRRISRRECSLCKRPTGIYAVTCNENPQWPAGAYNYQMAVIPGRIGENKRNRNNTFVNADV